MPNPFYWAGNEHNLLFPWVFHAVRSMSERATVQMTLADRGGPRMDCRMARRRLAGPIDRTTGRASCSTAAIRTSRAACQVRPGSGRPHIVHADHSSSFALCAWNVLRRQRRLRDDERVVCLYRPRLLPLDGPRLLLCRVASREPGTCVARAGRGPPETPPSTLNALPFVISNAARPRSAWATAATFR